MLDLRSEKNPLVTPSLSVGDRERGNNVDVCGTLCTFAHL